MSLQTALIDFSLPDTKEMGKCEEEIISLLNRQMEAVNLGGLAEESRHKGENVATVSLSGPCDLYILLRLRSSERLITLNIEGSFLCPSGSDFKDSGLPSSAPTPQPLWASQTDLGQWVARAARELGTERYNFLPAISRGLELSPYWTTTDDRIIECGITEVVHEEDSPYQNIQILDTIDFGRVLMLDGQTQLAESDLAYTRALMAGASFTDQEILILGGGDGALLAELLTQARPAMVTMVELDGAVMTAVRDHMASVTRGVLENHKGERHEIVTGDAIKYLEQCRENQRQFDVIFGDLTDVPIDTGAEASSLWDFISRILSLGLASVRTGGSYLTHVSGKALPATRDKFREKLTEVAESLGRQIDVQFTEAFVPSFMEVWVFSQITLKS